MSHFNIDIEVFDYLTTKRKVKVERLSNVIEMRGEILYPTVHTYFPCHLDNATIPLRIRMPNRLSTSTLRTIHMKFHV